MVKIFISYRRADSRKDAGRIYDRLTPAFGKDNIFKDVDSIPLGKDFRGILREAVAACQVQLVIIGRGWLDVRDESNLRRLDNPGDFVRIEVESALQRDSCLVVPVLVDGAAMPKADELPLELRELAFNNARVVRDDPDFHNDVSRIIRELSEIYQAEQPAALDPAFASPAPAYDVRAAIAEFFQAFEDTAWERARQLLTEIRASGKAPRIFDVDAHEREVWAAIETEERDKDYEVLRLMARRSNPASVWEALQVFWQSYPNHDPDNLARFQPASAPPPPTAIRKLSKPRSIDLLPAPFAWMPIPAGKVTLKTETGWAMNYIPEGKTETFDVPAFQIAKYPLTNDQFRLFVEAGGYTQDRWWTPDGLEARRQGIEWNWTGSKWEKQVTGTPWAVPRYWQDSKWNQSDCPVVGVSWYEAIAYCAWLSEQTGELIRLPTEQEWQRAAQGDDGRDYPWGKQWDGSRCNNNVDGKGISKTTPVTQYEGKNKGDSPFGAVDMAGNVWEWCSTAYESGKNDLGGTDVRVLRGGSWYNLFIDYFRCDYRLWDDPDDRNNFRGFRLALS
jgi:formylglycine-generating enzyme required for sulfatase activity